MRCSFEELSPRAKKFAVKMVEVYLWACGEPTTAEAIHECVKGVWFAPCGRYVGEKV